MRSLADAKSRWEETFKGGSTIAELQRAVKFDGPNSPCELGLRSICWKAFLLWRNAPREQWPELARKSRASYSDLCDQHLKFIKHPEQLAALTIDPLADDPASPWNAVRRDEAIRAEILQDVRRLPDEPFYHEEPVQAMMLDILFVYCKLNPGIGGYRQGMHELLAPLVWVVSQDAVDGLTDATGDPVDVMIADMLDPAFVEHDAFALFSKLMESAGHFYEADRDAASDGQQKNAIMERSKYIHEVALMKIDEELAMHLLNIEVLPQIFLIRWIRLLFGREFEFGEFLILWDTLFACDPTLELIDLICVAMLLRIRWTLLGADYSAVLQLMRKYPAPLPPHGPHTFVDDAIYLRDHLDASGGATLIIKYTGKSPAKTSAASPVRSRTPTSSFSKFSTFRQRTLGARTPLSTSARILQQPGGVEALLQGAAKNVMERGEKLGINRAVRDAVGELRRNVQGFQESRSSSRLSRSLSSENSTPSPDHSVTIKLMEKRNSRLAAMLEEPITNLKLLASSALGGEKEKHLGMIEAATAKIQFVKACLEDATLPLPEEDLPAINTLSASSPTEASPPTVAPDTTSVVTTSSAVEETRTALSTPESGKVSTPSPSNDSVAGLPVPQADEMDTGNRHEEEDTLSPLKSQSSNSPSTPPSPRPVGEVLPDSPPASNSILPQPNGSIPARSTLAQSSFAWMLEPDTTVSSSRSPSASLSSVRPPKLGSGATQKKRVNSSRERNAFLFGEATTADGIVLGDGAPLSADHIFGLQPIRKPG
ncbi:hypothetical protein VTH06DRAFT_3741 [Thermothelomyces fergusii]